VCMNIHADEPPDPRSPRPCSSACHLSFGAHPVNSVASGGRSLLFLLPGYLTLLVLRPTFSLALTGTPSGGIQMAPYLFFLCSFLAVLTIYFWCVREKQPQAYEA